MKYITRFIPAICVAFTLGTAPAAAQTSPGTMVPAPSPGSSVPAAAAAAAKPAPLPKSDEFATAAAATAHCPNGVIVWSTLSKGHSFHTSDSRYFGKTKHGAYLCKDDALAAGFHQQKADIAIRAAGWLPWI